MNFRKIDMPGNASTMIFPSGPPSGTNAFATAAAVAGLWIETRSRMNELLLGKTAGHSDAGGRSIFDVQSDDAPVGSVVVARAEAVEKLRRWIE
jgi:hypothetical protein